MTPRLFPHEERTSFGVMTMRVFIGHSGLLVLLWIFIGVFGLFGSSKIDQLWVACMAVLLFPFFTMIPLFDRLPEIVTWPLALLLVLGLWLSTVIFWTFVVTAIVWFCRRLRARHVINDGDVTETDTQVRSGCRGTASWLFPYSHPWTSMQKLMIAGAVSLGVVLIASFIVEYELRLRHRIKETLISHPWSEETFSDSSTGITFRRDNTIEFEDRGVGKTYRGSGTWHLEGRDWIVIDYQLLIDAPKELKPTLYRYHRRMHIDKLNSEEFLADDLHSQHFYQASNQAMKPTAPNE
jgi:hypothetical protein